MSSAATMATVGGYGLIGKEAPAFAVAPAITVTKANVAEGWQQSLQPRPPQSVLDASEVTADVSRSQPLAAHCSAAEGTKQAWGGNHNDSVRFGGRT